MRPISCLVLLCAALLLTGAVSAQGAETDLDNANASLTVPSQCRPAWPARAKTDAAHYASRGPLRIALLLDTTGRPLDSKMVRSSGHRDLDMAAMAALARCAFGPVLKGGVAVQKWVMVDYAWPASGQEEPRLIGATAQ